MANLTEFFNKANPKSLPQTPRFGRSEFKQSYAPGPAQRQLGGLGQNQALVRLISARLAQNYANSNY